MNVGWSCYAEDQQAEVLRYLAVKLSLEDAIRWAHRFHADVERLVEHPQLGHAVRPSIFARPPLLIERLREIRVEGYRIIYEVVEDEIRVLSLTHCSQMVDGDHLVWDR